MSGSNKKVNETIIRMVRDLKSTGSNSNTVLTVTACNEPEENSSPRKRSISSVSTEEFTPAKRLKPDFNLSYVASPRETNRLRADLLEARNSIMDLESRIKHMHHIRKQLEVLFDNETKSLKKQQEYDKKSIAELENQLQSIRSREAAVKLELSEMKFKYSKLKLSSEETIEALEKELSDLKNESQTVALDNDVEVFNLKQKNTELEIVAAAARNDAEAHKKLAEELGKQLNERNVADNELEMKKLELQKLKNQMKSLESAKDDYLQFQQQVKNQTQRLAKFVEIEKENVQLKEDFTRLKSDLKNKLVLEEEVHDLKNRLTKHKELEKRVSEIQLQSDQLQIYLNEWKAIARGFCETTENDAALPHLLRTAIDRLQQQELTLTGEKVEYESRMKTALHEAKLAKSEAEKKQKLLGELKLTQDQKQTLIHRMQKKLQLVSRERDSYRLQLDSYERDLTILVNNTTAGGSDVSQSQRERIENLEKIVENYRDLVAKLENDLQEAQPQLHSDIIPIRQEQISRLQEECAKLRSENEQLHEQKEKLEIQMENLNEGNDTLCGGKVLRLGDNLLSGCVTQRYKHLEQVEEENLKLKNKIKKLEQGIETSSLGEVSVCPQEVQALKEQIKSNEKQSQRLKDFFKSSMQDFRNVIYMLFGYKIDRPSNSSIYKLRSMYADNSEEYLCFEISQDGSLNLLENEYSATLESLIELHLMHQKSIPVFLSAITMDLFNQKTNY